MLQYLCAVKNGAGDGNIAAKNHHAAAASGSHHVPQHRQQRQAQNASKEGELYEKEVERTRALSLWQVIHVLISYIVSSPPSSFTEEVRAAFLEHVEFLLFCAVAQCRSLAAYGAAMRLPPVAAVGGVVKAPSVTGAATVSSSSASGASSSTSYPLPTQEMDYYWLAYFVLLLLGDEGVRLRLRYLVAPLFRDDAQRQRSHMNTNNNEDDAAQIDEGLTAVGNMLTELCLSYSQVLTREVRQPVVVLSDAGLNPTPGTSQNAASPLATDSSSGGGSKANKEAYVGDILHFIQEVDQNRLSVFPPPCIRQMLGWEPLVPLPSKRALIASTETLHVMARLSGIVTLVIEEMTAQNQLSLQRNRSAATSIHSIKPWSSTLLVWLLRLSSYCFIGALGAARLGDDENAGEAAMGAAPHRQLILSTCRVADLFSRITSAEVAASSSFTTTQSGDSQLVMMYVVAMQLCSLSRTVPVAAESAHRLIACVARQVLVIESSGDGRGNHSSQMSTAADVSAVNRTSARMTSIALSAIANVLQLVDGVESTVAVAVTEPTTKKRQSSNAPRSHHAPQETPLTTIGTQLHAGVRTFIGLVESIATEVRQAHLDAEHAHVTATRSAAGKNSGEYDENVAATAAHAQLHAAAMAGLQSSLSILHLWVEGGQEGGGEEFLLTSSETSWRLSISALELSMLQIHRSQQRAQSGDDNGIHHHHGRGHVSSMGSADELAELMISVATSNAKNSTHARVASWADAETFRKTRKAFAQPSPHSGDADPDVLDDPAPPSPARSPRASALSHRHRSGSSGSASVGGGGGAQVSSGGGGGAGNSRQRFDYVSTVANAPCSIVFGRSLFDVALWFFSRSLTKTATSAKSSADKEKKNSRVHPSLLQHHATFNTVPTLILMAESFAQLLLVAPDAVGQTYAYKLLDDVCALKRMTIAQEISVLHSKRDERQQQLQYPPLSSSSTEGALLPPEFVKGLKVKVNRNILELLEQQNALYSLKACPL
ncbi:Hypothetical protein, putative [Bodo saltans]|uniref:Uncharacterized protein n=1 Tax=Bodo saltans TaxID=75058 RepID=A0A0S4JV14_BODSA|nr:Hypothetical protein, putative [Bodo saltans]|eukprot:CUG92955.1 Hypothetical protein, putative [Bodo saltans]